MTHPLIYISSSTPAKLNPVSSEEMDSSGQFLSYIWRGFWQRWKSCLRVCPSVNMSLNDGLSYQEGKLIGYYEFWEPSVQCCLSLKKKPEKIIIVSFRQEIVLLDWNSMYESIAWAIFCFCNLTNVIQFVDILTYENTRLRRTSNPKSRESNINMGVQPV